MNPKRRFPSGGLLRGLGRDDLRAAHGWATAVPIAVFIVKAWPLAYLWLGSDCRGAARGGVAAIYML